MKYMLLIHWDEKAGAKRSPAADAEEVKQHGAFAEALGPRLVGGERLRPEADGARVKVRGGKRVVTDGPFAETKEALGGYYMIECGTKQEALEWAAKCPSAQHGTVEVRPVWAM